jgi:hypothetical protein
LTHQLFGNGAIGAALITGLTELFMFVLAVRLLPRGIFLASTVQYVGRCAGAGLLMAVAVVMVRDAPFLFVVAIGTVAYAIASLALKTLSVAELRRLGNELRGRGVMTVPSTRGEVGV